MLNRSLLLAGALLPLLSVGVSHAAEPVEKASPDAEGFVRDWLLLTPAFYDPLFPIGRFDLDKAQVPGEAALRPKEGDKIDVPGKTLAWTAQRAGGFFLDVNRAIGVEKSSTVIGYAVAYVVSKEAQPDAVLRVGSSDQVKVWVNGKLVIRYPEARPLERDDNQTPVALKKGLNVVVFKILNTEMAWQLAARFTDGKGTPLPGLQVALSPSEAAADRTPDAEGFLRDFLLLAPLPFVHPPFATGQLERQPVSVSAFASARAGRKVWANGYELTWTPWKADKKTVDLNAFARSYKNWIGPDLFVNGELFNGIVHGVVFVDMPNERRDLKIGFGTNDQGKVWVNGQPVIKLDRPGPFKADEGSAPVVLRKGRNVIGIKIINGGGNWEAGLRFLDKTGKPVTDLAISTRALPPPSILTVP